MLELNKNNEQVLRRQLEATQDRFRVGEITRTDVSQERPAYPVLRQIEFKQKAHCRYPRQRMQM